MNISKLTATLTEAELELLIMVAVNKKTGRGVDSVSFNIGTRRVGYGTTERDEHYFEGAIVTFTPNQDIKSGKP